VSHTTRSPRAGEVEGVAYFFVSVSEFADLVSKNAFLEHTTFGGHFYGTSKKTIVDQTAKERVAVLDIEMDGVNQIKTASDIDARFVFIKPPSIEVLEDRLRRRNTEKEEDIQKRLALAQAELDYADTPDVHDIIIVNDNLEDAYRELEAFVYKARMY
jgi:guanylate kinase